MADRNLLQKWSDLVAGPPGQTSNLELLRNFLFTPRTQPAQPLPANYPGQQIDNSMFERGKYVNMNELLGVPMPQGQQRPPIPQEYLDMPTDAAVSAYRNSLYPTLATPPTIQSPIEPQRNETLNTAQGNLAPQQPNQQPNRNNLLMAALFGGVAPLVAAAFGGETGLAAGSGMAQGFGTQFAKQQELNQTLANKPWQPITREEQIAFEKEKLGIKAESPQEKQKTKRTDFLDSTRLRQEFENRPEVKEYVAINTQVSSMDSLLKKAKAGNIQNKVALDQALITMFNKLTDPNSVVRESEYARTPSNLPLANRFTGALQKLQMGGAGLTDSDREALVWGAKVIADERGNTFSRTLQSFENLSEEYGIDKKFVSRGFQKHKNYIEEQAMKVKMIAPDGTTWEVDQSEVEEAKKHGWK